MLLQEATMLIYTAGPYSPSAGAGTVEENIQRAREAALQLWEAGYTVICPHLNTANFEEEIDLQPKDYVDRDLEIVERCDAIVMLPKWQQSLGAVRELEHALANDVDVYYWPEVPPLEAQKPKPVRKGHKLEVRGTRASAVKS
jgi:hypothetical protein